MMKRVKERHRRQALEELHRLAGRLIVVEPAIPIDCAMVHVHTNTLDDTVKL